MLLALSPAAYAPAINTNVVAARSVNASSYVGYGPNHDVSAASLDPGTFGSSHSPAHS